jgi:hypothetical protein
VLELGIDEDARVKDHGALPSSPARPQLPPSSPGSPTTCQGPGLANDPPRRDEAAPMLHCHTPPQCGRARLRHHGRQDRGGVSGGGDRGGVRAGALQVPGIEAASPAARIEAGCVRVRRPPSRPSPISSRYARELVPWDLCFRKPGFVLSGGQICGVKLIYWIRVMPRFKRSDVSI